jgi:hypothetical protein
VLSYYVWLHPFLDRAQLLTQKLVKQGYVALRFTISLQKFYGRNHKIAWPFWSSELKTMVHCTCSILICIRLANTMFKSSYQFGFRFRTDVASDSRSERGVQHYVIKFISGLRQVSGFLLVFLIPPPIKTDSHDITEILLKMALNTIILNQVVVNPPTIRSWLPQLLLISIWAGQFIDSATCKYFVYLSVFSHSLTNSLIKQACKSPF